MNKHTFLKNSTMIATIVILTGMLLPAKIYAQKKDRFLDKVIGADSFKVIHADKIIRNKRQKQFTFTGNVAMQIHKDTVTCDSAIFNYKKSTVVVYGHITSSPRWTGRGLIPGYGCDGQTYFIKTGNISLNWPVR